MHAFYTFLALDLATERAAEARAAHRAALGAQRGSPSLVRRTIARVALAIARAADEDLRVSLSTH